MFQKISLKVKLIMFSLSMAIMTAAVGLSAILLQAPVTDAYQSIAKINLNNVSQIGNLRVAFKNARLLSFQAADTSDPKERAELGERILDAIKQFEEANKHYLEVEFLPGEKELYEPMYETWKNHSKSLEHIAMIAKSPAEDDSEKLDAEINGEFKSIARIFDPQMDKLVQYHLDAANRSKSEAQKDADKLEITLFVLVTLSALLALSMGWIIASSLSKQLNQLAGQMASEAQALSHTATEMSAASVESSAALTEQAAALQETVASIDEISAMVNKNAENANRSLQVSQTSKAAAGSGREAVDQMLRSMSDISQSNQDIMLQSETSNAEIAKIVKIISEIGNKTKVINDIVFQTKLLSFNASVEAARAGEHGKGFAVVAEEVGNLAQMSGNAAREISQMLEQSVQTVERTVQDTQQKLERLVNLGRDRIEQGSTVARRCGDALNEIVRQVDDLDLAVREISAASREQSQGIQEISRAMSQIDQGMQQNSLVAEQSSKASEDLSTQASNLDGLVKGLSRTLSGGDGEIQATAPVPQTRVPAPRPKLVASQAKVAPKAGAPRMERSAAPEAAPMKKAAGAEVPDQNDPRFEEF